MIHAEDIIDRVPMSESPGSPKRVYLTHPKTGEKLTLNGWAAKLGLSRSYFRNKYEDYLSGKINTDLLFRPNQRPRKAKPAQPVQPNNVPIASFVFRPDFEAEGVVYSYAAYNPDDLLNPIMGAIVRVDEGKWRYNCYPFGDFDTRSDLVRKFLQLQSMFTTYDDFILYLNDITRLPASIEDDLCE